MPWVIESKRPYVGYLLQSLTEARSLHLWFMSPEIADKFDTEEAARDALIAALTYAILMGMPVDRLATADVEEVHND